MKIRTWVMSGLVYLTLVIVGYAVITGNSILEGGDHEEHHAHATTQEEEELMNNHDHHHSTHSEVEVNVDQNEDSLTFTLEDPNGEPPELAVNHEKEMHLIAVSNDLKAYHHLHPERLAEGVYEVEHSLQPGTYHLFVDITPKEFAYAPEAIPLQVGEAETKKVSLETDRELEKEIQGKKVQLDVEGKTTEETTTLTFSTDYDNLEPYLGALGHVVVIDEDVEQFIHVHPTANDATTFEAHFQKPGTYKLWAEFKYQDAGVIAFPFVIEIK
ncbi:hypothetical protein [Geomicrobium sp. JCM 19038]|uniref:hypothetical protein n=1 Tax=Geomicrobium sp. JCM 19038 TaxID=1460635 RepID=UPI00045F1E09|nr:hypothetical protein [Geomicrobium sp. JCM 19038]GAK09814.1 putative secreted protein [Geomicrobium sp. JCM 19038]